MGFILHPLAGALCPSDSGTPRKNEVGWERGMVTGAAYVALMREIEDTESARKIIQTCTLSLLFWWPWTNV